MIDPVETTIKCRQNATRPLTQQKNDAFVIKARFK